MNRFSFIALSLLLLVFFLSACKKKEREPGLDEKSAFIAKIHAYQPAPGQFINDPFYGTLEKAQELIGGVNQGLVSLGAFGGSLIFSFDHPLLNRQGYDLGIFGNPLIGEGMEWSEPGIVCVMKDLNGNGLPDDGEWFELAGSAYHDPSTVHQYTITYYKPAANEDIYWTDNQGASGYILKNHFHTQDWFPSGHQQLTFQGTKLANTLREGGIITNQPFAFGYADNGSSHYIRLQNQWGRGYNVFDLDWAVNSAGKPVKLDQIDFIKVYTAQNCNGNPYHPQTDHPRSRYLGEISTEIAGAVDLSLYEK